MKPVLLTSALCLLVANATAGVSFPDGQSAYLVVKPSTPLEIRVSQEFADYAEKVLHAPVKQVSSLALVPAGAPAIILATGHSEAFPDVSAPDGSPEAFALRTTEKDGHPVVLAIGATDVGFKRAVQRLTIRTQQVAPGLVVPELNLSERPWIGRREWSEPSWTPEFVRGVWHNPNGDKRNDIWRYSKEEMQRYVDLLDWLGYNGGQLHDTAIAYANFGSIEAATDRMGEMAQDLKASGDHVTAWVWASQFHGFGWVDPQIVDVPAPGKTAFNDPRIHAGYEKYYDIFARLAPVSDLLIAHFYDPGTLKNKEDVFAYMHLLMNKFRAANPQVQLGADSWYSGSEADYMKGLVDHGFRDVLFLENTMPHTYPPGKREALHTAAKQYGLQLGVWGWHTAEKETDQDANMYVNAQLLSRFYRQMRDGVCRIYPVTYWSEMEAYHLNNVFTHYAAAQLLWNPDRDPDELLKEIAEGIFGPRNGADILAALHLIQDARSGPTWETYWGHSVMRTNDPADIRNRADACIAAFEAMKIDPVFVPKFPLPFPPKTWIELILPHLRQIRAFADFRISFAELEGAAKTGMPKDELERRTRAIWIPVPEYTNWIGMFGPVEDRMQEQMILQFAKDHGFTLQAPGWVRWRDAEKQRDGLATLQRALAEPYRFSLDAPVLTRGFSWSAEKGRDRVQLLIDNGVIEKAGDRYQLTDWNDYSLH